MRIPGRTLNSDLTASTGVEVAMIETLPVQAGSFVDVHIDKARHDWRQGIWFGTEGMLEIVGPPGPQKQIWTDTAPPSFAMRIVETEGLLHFYNVWDSGRGFGRESQSASSGMVLLDEKEGWRRYGCNDIGKPPDFQKLVFWLRVR